MCGEEDVTGDLGGCAEGDEMSYPNVWMCFPFHPLIYEVVFRAYEEEERKREHELRQML